MIAQRLTLKVAAQHDPSSADCANMDEQSALPTVTAVGGSMSATPYSPTRQPVMPSSGGLMGRSFTYRTAEKTDVRLTWERAKAVLVKTKPQS